ncbi:MAG TPA: hypothetical protein VJ861_08880 [Treponemataceae bacterium]|nr:hypothetical protein [Treponemataceae bacterium]
MQTLSANKPQKQKNLVHNFCLCKVFLSIGITASVFLSSCAVKSPISLVDPLSVLGPQSTTYVVIPVKQNRDLLNLITSQKDSSEDSKDTDSYKTALDRTEIVFAGLSTKQNTERSAALLAFGSYPKAAISLIFPKKNGWKKVSEKNIGSWYTSDSLEASIPENGMILASTSGSLRALLTTRHNPEPTSVSPGFSLFAQNALEDGRIGVYLSDPAFLVQLIFGSEISFPITAAEIYAKPPETKVGTEPAQMGTEPAYLLSARIELLNERSARVFGSILRLTLGISFIQQESAIIISEIPVKQETLADFVNNMYFLF